MISSLSGFLRFAIRALAISLLFVVSASALPAQNAFVRIDQLGYEAGVHNRAYLMSKTSESSAIFRVIAANGEIRCSSPVGAAATWGAFNVYALDFLVNEPGHYTIEVNGPVSTTSATFRIDAPTKLYSGALVNALNFYRNERDGENFIKTPLRSAPGHLNDEHAALYLSPSFTSDDLILGALKPTGGSIDASGGWWDAGDYLKFVQTHSYTVALMLVGIRDFPAQMGSATNASDFTKEAKFGLDWLLKMWDSKSQTLYYQVGIGTDFNSSPDILSDHDLWRLPQADDTIGDADPNLQYVRHRPVFVAGPAGSKISPNLAGRLAASFAGCFQVYAKTSPAFAQKCLVAAEQIFDLADTAPAGDLLTVAPFDFYGEDEWRDDMELGATELYFALAGADGPLPSTLHHTDPAFYLRAAAHWAHAYITGPNDAADTLNLYDVSGLAHFELFRAIAAAGHPSKLEVTQHELVNDIRKELDSATALAAADPFGYGFPWDAYDSATHGAGLAVMAREYALLTKSSTFDAYSRRWSANILGANSWGSSFIVGDGDTFPNCMQHQVANIAGSPDGTPPVLAGALVEGPNSFAATGFLDGMRKCPPEGGNVFKKFNANGAVYKDNQQSYSTVEPAIDLTAASFLMFAWRTAGSPAVFLPVADISPALDQSLGVKPNPKWPPRRGQSRQLAHRSTALTSE